MSENEAAPVGLEAGRPAAPAPRRDRGAWGALLLLVAVGVAAYADSFSGVFLLDDYGVILNNPEVRSVGRTRWTHLSRRVVLLSLAANYALGRDDPAGYHAVNLAIHLLAGMTLFGLVRRTLAGEALRDRLGRWPVATAAVVAAIWLVHPLQTGAVTYVVQRAESLAGLFYLLTLYLAARGADPAARAVRAWQAAAVAACALGMMTKEVVATAPLVVLAYDRTFLSGSFARALKQRAALYAGLAATWALLAAGLWTTGYGGLDPAGRPSVGPIAYGAAQFGAILLYLRLAFWPVGQCLDYGLQPPADAWQVVVPAAVVLALLALAAAGLARRRAWGFPAAAFFLILAPTSSILPLADLAFEHRMYLPLAAVVALAVVAAAQGADALLRRRIAAPWRRRTLGRMIGLGAPGIAVAALALLTARRNRLYHSGLAMWQDVLAKRGRRHTRALNHYGSCLAEAGQIDEAVDAFRQAVAVDGADARSRANLARALRARGALDASIEQFRRALTLAPRSARAHNGLGVSLYLTGSLDAAAEHYAAAIAAEPYYEEPYYNLALVEVRRKRPDEAERLLRQAVALKPGYREAQWLLCKVLLDQQKVDEALAHLPPADRADDAAGYALVAAGLVRLGRTDQALTLYGQALRLRPGEADLLAGLAAALLQAGDETGAASSLAAALQQRPGDAALMTRLAWLLAAGNVDAVRNAGRAISLATSACDATGYNAPQPMDALAAAFAEAGRFDHAVQMVSAAIELARRRGDDELVRAMQARRDRYQVRRPWRRGRPTSRTASAPATQPPRPD